MNFVSTIIVDKKNNKKWLLIGLTIILLGIIVVIVSFKIVNKKPIDDIQKPINYQEQLKEMLEKSTNQSKYKLNIEFDIDLDKHSFLNHTGKPKRYPHFYIPYYLY